MMLLILAGPIARASINLGMNSVGGRLFVIGLVMSGSVCGSGLSSFVTLGVLWLSVIVSVLVGLEV